jgi:DNA-binding NarL/FixJ family response regulator
MRGPGMTDVCVKTVNLLFVSENSSGVSAIVDSISDGALFPWKIETASNFGAALRKVAREHFDICLVDNSFSEADSHHFLTNMAAEHPDLALVILNSSEDGLLSPEFEGLIDGRISLPKPAPSSAHLARKSPEIGLLAALLARKDREIKNKAARIEELNSALNVVIHRAGKDAFEIEERIQVNLKLLIFPYFEQLRNSRLQSGQQWCLDIIENNIRRIFSPFLKNLTAKTPRLSFAETRVADLIREGKSSKEIACTLGVSEKTVLTHRFHIRTKLGIKNKEVSLASYLASFQQC